MLHSNLRPQPNIPGLFLSFFWIHRYSDFFCSDCFKKWFLLQKQIEERSLFIHTAPPRRDDFCCISPSIASCLIQTPSSEAWPNLEWHILVLEQIGCFSSGLLLVAYHPERDYHWAVLTCNSCLKVFRSKKKKQQHKNQLYVLAYSNPIRTACGRCEGALFCVRTFMLHTGSVTAQETDA